MELTYSGVQTNDSDPSEAEPMMTSGDLNTGGGTPELLRNLNSSSPDEVQSQPSADSGDPREEHGNNLASKVSNDTLVDQPGRSSRQKHVLTARASEGGVFANATAQDVHHTPDHGEEELDSNARGNPNVDGQNPKVTFQGNDSISLSEGDLSGTKRNASRAEDSILWTLTPTKSTTRSLVAVGEDSGSAEDGASSVTAAANGTIVTAPVATPANASDTLAALTPRTQPHIPVPDRRDSVLNETGSPESRTNSSGLALPGKVTADGPAAIAAYVVLGLGFLVGLAVVAFVVYRKRAGRTRTRTRTRRKRGSENGQTLIPLADLRQHNSNHSPDADTVVYAMVNKRNKKRSRSSRSSDPRCALLAESNGFNSYSPPIGIRHASRNNNDKESDDGAVTLVDNDLYEATEPLPNTDAGCRPKVRVKDAIASKSDQEDGYLAPSCHDHPGKVDANWKPFHDYDPVYVPTSDAQGIQRRLDDAGYVTSKKQRKRAPHHPYEEVTVASDRQGPPLMLQSRLLSSVGPPPPPPPSPRPLLLDRSLPALPPRMRTNPTSSGGDSNARRPLPAPVAPVADGSLSRSSESESEHNTRRSMGANSAATFDGEDQEHVAASFSLEDISNVIDNTERDDVTGHVYSAIDKDENYKEAIEIRPASAEPSEPLQEEVYEPIDFERS